MNEPTTTLENDTVILEQLEYVPKCHLFVRGCENEAQFIATHINCGYVWFVCGPCAGEVLANPDNWTTFAHDGKDGFNSDIKITSMI